jgi:predicted chitinase
VDITMRALLLCAIVCCLSAAVLAEEMEKPKLHKPIIIGQQPSGKHGMKPLHVVIVPKGDPRAYGRATSNPFNPQTPSSLVLKASAPMTSVTTAQLVGCMPGLSSTKANTVLPYLNQANAEAQINTCDRMAAWLAQLGHESGSLVYMQELASGAAYEGRRDLGNTQPGDGRRFKGRGPIQLTGRANYAAAGKALGMNLIANPTIVATNSVGFKTSAWFWKGHGLNALADSGAFSTITRRINGGTNGAADRNTRWAKCKAVLHC